MNPTFTPGEKVVWIDSKNNVRLGWIVVAEFRDEDEDTLRVALRHETNSHYRVAPHLTRVGRLHPDDCIGQ